MSPKLYFPYKQVLPAVCPIRHCLDRLLSLNSCICKANPIGGFFLGNLCVFVPVAQTVNCGIYWAFLKVCRNAILPISPELLYNILITHRIHAACHISLAVQQCLVMKQTVAVPNCMWLLSVTETQELTQFIVSLQYVEFNRKQQQVQQPSQIGLPVVLQPMEVQL